MVNLEIDLERSKPISNYAESPHIISHLCFSIFQNLAAIAIWKYFYLLWLDQMFFFFLKLDLFDEVLDKQSVAY